MQYTTNLNLKKPDYTDPPDIGEINSNFDIIDSAVRPIETWGDLGQIKEYIPVPTIVEDTFAYTGESQSPAWQNYDSSKITISGTQSATEPGTYVTKFTPKEGYGWDDMIAETREISWTIKMTLSRIWGNEDSLGDTAWWSNLQGIILNTTPEDRTACIGKTKKVTLTTPVLGTQIHYVRCIGADQDGDKTLTFQTTTCMKDSTVFGSNAVWIGSTARAKCQEYYNAFPGKSYVKTVKKGTCPGTDSSRNASVAYNDETVFLLSEREFGLDIIAPISTANSTTTKAECTQGYNAPYSYYNSDSRRIFYKDNGSGAASSDYGYPWERSRYYDSSGSDYVGFVYYNGTATNYRYNSSYGLAPAFVIG